jgi:hypothetical protein
MDLVEDGTAFHRVDSKAIGAGILLANNLTEEYYDPRLSLSELINIAAFILWKVKKGVDSCGGHTDLIGFVAESASHVRPATLISTVS